MGSRLSVNKVCTETHACFVFACLKLLLHFATCQHPFVTKGSLIWMSRRFSQQMLLINIFCNTIGTMPHNVTKLKKKNYMYFDPSMSHHEVAITDVEYYLVLQFCILRATLNDSNWTWTFLFLFLFFPIVITKPSAIDISTVVGFFVYCWICFNIF